MSITTAVSLTSLYASIPKFSGTNWVTFKKDVEVYFQLEGLWEIVSGAEVKP
jgi:gag-polypeptide of LTR copia-type